MRAVALATLVAVSGCSFMTVRPPRRHPNGYIECASTAPVGLDAAAAVTGGLIAALAAVGSNQGRPDDDDEKRAGAYALIAGGIYAASALYGRSQVRRCREERAALLPVWMAAPVIDDAHVIEHETEEIEEVRTTTRRTWTREVPTE